MANQYQNKSEYVKPHSVSLKPSEYIRYKKQAKEVWGMSFSEMVRVLFSENEDLIKSAKTLNDEAKIDFLKVKRLKKLQELKR